MDYKFTYSDDWHNEGYRFEEKILIEAPVYFRHVYDTDGMLAGILVDYETADDVHYELTAENWKKFCNCYLDGKDDEGAFRDFISVNPGPFTLEYALNKEKIVYKKLAYY